MSEEATLPPRPGPTDPSKISYRNGYKYQLMDTFRLAVPELAGQRACLDDWIELADGLLTVKYGYAWDGPSGPTADTPSFMRGPLAHDAGYQLLREGLLPEEARVLVDAVMLRLILEDIAITYADQDGEGWFSRLRKEGIRGAAIERANGWHQAVRLAAGGAGSQNANRPTFTAP